VIEERRANRRFARQRDRAGWPTICAVTPESRYFEQGLFGCFQLHRVVTARE
jgi:hypothetical protein